MRQMASQTLGQIARHGRQAPRVESAHTGLLPDLVGSLFQVLFSPAAPTPLGFHAMQELVARGRQAAAAASGPSQVSCTS